METPPLIINEYDLREKLPKLLSKNAYQTLVEKVESNKELNRIETKRYIAVTFAEWITDRQQLIGQKRLRQNINPQCRVVCVTNVFANFIELDEEYRGPPANRDLYVRHFNRNTFHLDTSLFLHETAIWKISGKKDRKMIAWLRSNIKDWKNAIERISWRQQQQQQPSIPVNPTNSIQSALQGINLPPGTTLVLPGATNFAQGSNNFAQGSNPRIFADGSKPKFFAKGSITIHQPGTANRSEEEGSGLLDGFLSSDDELENGELEDDGSRLAPRRESNKKSIKSGDDLKNDELEDVVVEDGSQLAECREPNKKSNKSGVVNNESKGVVNNESKGVVMEDGSPRPKCREPNTKSNKSVQKEPTNENKGKPLVENKATKSDDNKARPSDENKPAKKPDQNKHKKAGLPKLNVVVVTENVRDISLQDLEEVTLVGRAAVRVRGNEDLYLAIQINHAQDGITKKYIKLAQYKYVQEVWDKKLPQCHDFALVRQAVSSKNVSNKTPSLHLNEKHREKTPKTKERSTDDATMLLPTNVAGVKRKPLAGMTNSSDSTKMVRSDHTGKALPKGIIRSSLTHDPVNNRKVSFDSVCAKRTFFISDSVDTAPCSTKRVATKAPNNEGRVPEPRIKLDLSEEQKENLAKRPKFAVVRMEANKPTNARICEEFEGQISPVMIAASSRRLYVLLENRRVCTWLLDGESIQRRFLENETNDNELCNQISSEGGIACISAYGPNIWASTHEGNVYQLLDAEDGPIRIIQLTPPTKPNCDPCAVVQAGGNFVVFTDAHSKVFVTGIWPGAPQWVPLEKEGHDIQEVAWGSDHVVIRSIGKDLQSYVYVANIKDSPSLGLGGNELKLVCKEGTVASLEISAAAQRTSVVVVSDQSNTPRRKTFSIFCKLDSTGSVNVFPTKWHKEDDPAFRNIFLGPEDLAIGSTDDSCSLWVTRVAAGTPEKVDLGSILKLTPRRVRGLASNFSQVFALLELEAV